MEEFKTKTKFYNFLGYENLISDITTLPKKFKYFIFIAMFVIVFFNFFDVQGQAHNQFFLPISTFNDAMNNGSTFGQPNDRSASIVVAVLYSLNGLASFTGILAVAMITYGKTSQYFWGAINALVYGLFAISVGYAGDFFMQIILLLGAPIGWYLFEVKRLAYKEEKRQTWKQNIFFFLYAAIAITIFTLVIYEFLPNATYDIFHTKPYEQDGKTNQAMLILDSMTNGFNLGGYGMQLTNMSQQFYIWMCTDTLRVLKFTGLAGSGTLSVNMLIEFSIWLLMDFIGIYNRNFKTRFEEYLRLKRIELIK